MNDTEGKKEKDPLYYEDGRRRRVTVIVDEYGKQKTIPLPEPKNGKPIPKSKVEDLDIERGLCVHMFGENVQLCDLHKFTTFDHRFRLTKKNYKSIGAARRRMLTAHRVLRVFDRPVQQEYVPNSENNKLFYTNTDLMRGYLEQKELLFENVPGRSSSFMHDAMQTKCAMGAFFDCCEMGFPYAAQHEILTRREILIPIPQTKDEVAAKKKQRFRHVRPDFTFGFMPTDTMQLMFCEVDRHTERGAGGIEVQADNSTQTLTKKVIRWGHILQHELYKQITDHEGPVKVIFITTTPARVRLIKEIIQSNWPKGRHDMLVTWTAGFMHPYNPPEAMHMFNGRTWERCVYPPIQFVPRASIKSDVP